MVRLLDRLEARVARARQRRWLHIVVIVLRMMIGFAFLPAGLKKLVGEPFTDPANTGIFHEFLHVFRDTGGFYHFVGCMQLLAAVLLITQRFAAVGAVILTPILTVILVFCWSTNVIPTASVVTLMSLGLLFLVLWDVTRWRLLFARGGTEVTIRIPGPHPTVDMRLWIGCGVLILVLYLGSTLIAGEIYRPMGADWNNPSFIVLQVIMVLPLITFVVDYRRHRRKTADKVPGR
jgi:uncharacterized membrane protein YphA (DoxX/SURF4 family)